MSLAALLLATYTVFAAQASGGERGLPFSDGQAASTALGQSDLTAAEAGAGATGQNDAAGVAFDDNGMMWVADTFNNRILGYERPFETGEAATVVIGQSDFDGTEASASQTGLNGPFGLAFDSEGNMWVADTSNNRVVRYEAPFSTGMAASVVLGQPDFDDSAAALSSTGLNQPGDVDVDEDGNVWVSDYKNNRVLKFEGPYHNGMAASVVIGQQDFTSGEAATTSIGLRSPIGGVAFDGDGNLWVSDTENHRVLGYQGELYTGMAASVVIGQQDFTSGDAATTATTMCYPTSLTFDRSGNLWLSDGLNDRVLGYDAGDGLQTGMAASRVLGQSDLTSGGDRCGGGAPESGTGTASATSLAVPAGMDFDRNGDLWVTDSFNHRTVKYSAHSKR